MRKLITSVAAAAFLSVPAHAATVLLDSVTSVSDGYEFSYAGTLDDTEGLRNGSQLVIFDFAGYVDGSVFSPYDDVSASVEYSNPDFTLAPGVTDDPGLVNLVFTWTGDDFQTSGGPFSDIDFSGLTAVSTYGQIFTDGFSTLTVKNEGLGAEGTDLYTQGYVGVPGVPEPETWLMMIGGFGLVGWQLRRRKVRTEALA